MARESLKIIRVPLAELKPDTRNARKHNERNLEAIRKSLESFGQVEPLVVQKATRRVIGGHGRIEAMKAAGLTHADIVEVDIDDKKAISLGLALNRTAELAEWDTPMLADLLRNLDKDAAIGWSSDDLLVLCAPVGSEGLVDPDDVPAPPDAATTVPGDIWVLGNHRLMCGDSSKPEDLDRLLDGQPIHLVNTDPPYNVKVEPRSNNAIAAGLSSADLHRYPEKSKPTHKKLRAKDRPLANDFVSDQEFAAWRTTSSCASRLGAGVAFMAQAPFPRGGATKTPRSCFLKRAAVPLAAISRMMAA